MQAQAPGERIVARLAALLGPNMARTATRTFCGRLGLEPDTLSRADVPRLAAALRPALRTLLGAVHGDQVVSEILEEFR